MEVFMGDYVIVSDATLDLPAEVVKENDIHVIPMGLTIDDVEYMHYPDERNLSISDFYGKLKNGSVSRTSQITPAAFHEYFTEILKEGKDILYIAFSSGLSGTYNTSRLVISELAEEYPDRKIYSIDSLCASIGEGLLVYLATQQKKNGMNIDELRDWVEANKQKVRHWFTVKDLYYLKRGGRISSVEAFVGTTLKIRPVLSTDDYGKLVVKSKLRGSKAELEFLVGRLEAEGIDTKNQTIIIAHGDNFEQVKELEALIRERNLVKDIIISNIGPVIGTHTGPGMLALTFVGNEASI